jgi:hypothetical protein
VILSEPGPTKQEEPLKREPRRYRTGRNVQHKIKVRAETLGFFYALADEEGWVLGETLERAIAVLTKELAAARMRAWRVGEGVQTLNSLPQSAVI